MYELIYFFNQTLIKQGLLFFFFHSCFCWKCWQQEARLMIEQMQMQNGGDFQLQNNNTGTDLHSEWGIIAIIINRRSIIRVAVLSLGHFGWCVMCGSVRDAKKKKKEARKWVNLGQENRKMKVLNHTGPFSALQHNRATLILSTQKWQNTPWSSKNRSLGESSSSSSSTSRPYEPPAASGGFSMTNTHHPLPYYLSLYFSVPRFPPAVCLPLRSYYVYDSQDCISLLSFLDQWK